MQVVFAGAAAIAMLALFDAAQPGTGDTTVASGSVRLADHTTDLPAPPPWPPGVVLPPGDPLQTFWTSVSKSKLDTRIT